MPNSQRGEKEEWKDTKSGKACGAGGENEYCRPSKRVSKKTPKTSGEMSPKELESKQREKSQVGMQGAFGDKVSAARRNK